MIIKNPTDQIVGIVFEGQSLQVGPNSTVEVSDVAGEYWMKVHEFLVVGKEAKVEEVKVEKKEEVVIKKSKKE